MKTKDQIMQLAKDWEAPKQTKRGKISKLEPYMETIKYMRSARHLSYKQIHKFILDTGVNVTYQYLMLYINKKKSK